MDRLIELDSDLKPVAYAWLGGYQMFYLATEGWRDSETGILEDWHKDEFVLCPDCAGKAAENDHILTAADINYEDTELYCEQCNERIPSCYGEDSDGEDSEDSEDSEDNEND